MAKFNWRKLVIDVIKVAMGAIATALGFTLS